MAILILSLALLPIIIAEIFDTFYGFPFTLWKRTDLRIGDKIVYTKTKFSMCPTERAELMFPSERGEDYSYVVEKYWVVAGRLADGRLVARTRTGKTHYLRPNDANLHKAKLVDRVLHGERFPDLALAA